METEDKVNSNTTQDAIYNGKIVLVQPSDGYRFSIDAILLTGFASECGFARKVIDLGAGCGIVGLGLLAAGTAERVVAVEVQPRLAQIARKNGQINEVAERYEVYEGSICAYAETASDPVAELVVSNPPFWPIGSGRLPENEERRIACHEVHCGIDDWVGAAAKLIHQRNGRLAVIYPARRLDALLMAAKRARLSATRMRFVHPLREEAAELVLVEARVGSPGRIVVEPPIVLKEPGGGDSEEAAALVSGEFAERLKGIGDRRRVRV